MLLAYPNVPRKWMILFSAAALLAGWCLLPTAVAQSAVSQAEKDDLAFIKNLYRDKIYLFAKQETESFFNKFPDSKLIPEVVLIQAQIDTVEGNFDLALRRYNRIIGQYPDSPLVEDALYFSGFLKLQLNVKEGLIDFNRLISKFPNSKYLAKVSFRKGELAFREQQWKVAEFQFKNVLNSEGITDQQRHQTQNNLAWVYYYLGNTLLAKSMFFDLLETSISKEEKAKIAFQLGREAQKNNRCKNAIAWFQRQLSDWPNPEIRPQSRFWIAECYYQEFKENPKLLTTGKKEKAVQLFTENLQRKKPISPLISRYHRGWLLDALNRKREAEKDFSWLQKNSRKYAADLELTATRTKYYEAKNDLKTANRIYINALQYQDKSEIRNMLLIGVIRNAHTLNDCNAIIKWKNKTNLSKTDKEATELHFYVGQCYFTQKKWKKAGAEFSKIPPGTSYARAVFPSYFQVFKKTRNFKSGMSYLDRVKKLPGYGSRQKIMLLKIDLCLTLERWPDGIDRMLRVKKEFPEKAKDPWYLLNIAKTADQVYFAYHKPKHPMHQYPVKKRKFYANLALNHYQTAYRYLPKQEKETKLSVLDILIARYKALGSHRKVVALYRDALQLLNNQERRDELRLMIAGILLNDLKQTQKAQLELHKIHNKGNSNTHFRASSLLAELYVDQKKLIQAIKILEDLASQPIQKTQWFATTHFRLGELYQANERWQKAVQHYDSVVADNRDGPLAQQAKSRTVEIKKYLDRKG